MVENIENTTNTNQTLNITNTQFNPYYIFKATCKNSPNTQSITYKNQKYTSEEILFSINKFAEFLAGNFTNTNSQNILYSAKNHPLLLITYLAAAKLQKTFIPINPALSDKDKKHIIDETNPVIHITNENLDQYYEKTFVNKNLHLTLKETNPNTSNNIGAILYTSGSSGKPKGVQLSYENLWWGSKNLKEGFQYNYSDKMLVLAPMSHIGGFNGCTIDILINGGSITIADSLEATHILDIIEKEKITITFAVPTLYEKILSTHTTQNIQTLRLPLTGGSPVPKTLIEKAKQHGLKLLPVWGMTEISASGTYLPQKLLDSKPNNIGLPFPHIEIQILDLQTRKPITENGKIGEIAVKGKSVTKGYLGRPIPDNENFHENLLLTKDLGCWYENKYVQITGRKTDLIITGGEHVFPTEIDEVLQTYPNVQNCKTFSIKDTYWGEKIVSALVFSQTFLETQNLIHEKNILDFTPNTKNEIIISEGNETYENIKKFLLPKLAKYKIPKEIMIIKTMPLLPNGKIDTQTLKEKYSKINTNT